MLRKTLQKVKSVHSCLPKYYLMDTNFHFHYKPQNIDEKYQNYTVFMDWFCERLGKVKKPVVHQEDLYDSIVDIDSIRFLNKTGWKVYQKKSHQKYPIIPQFATCVLGNFNKGKTWFLSHISQKNLKAGHHVHTKGLSICYDDDVAFLDTAGFEMPTPIHKYLTDFIKEKELDKQLLSNPDFKISDIKESLIKTFHEDKYLTEKLIQNFIIEISDHLFIIVDQITFSDQKLINSLCSKYRGTKNISIVHNLSNLTEMSHVRDHIESKIKQIFNVIPRNYKLKTPKIFGDEEITVEAYNDIDYSNSSPDKKTNVAVEHFVLARENSQAGNQINNPTLELLRSRIKNNAVANKVDVIESLKSYLAVHLNQYLRPDHKEAKPIKIYDSTKVKEDGLLPDYTLSSCLMATRLGPVASYMLDVEGNWTQIDNSTIGKQRAYWHPKKTGRGNNIVWELVVGKLEKVPTKGDKESWKEVVKVNCLHEGRNIRVKLEINSSIESEIKPDKYILEQNFSQRKIEASLVPLDTNILGSNGVSYLDGYIDFDIEYENGLLRLTSI